jgi:hypothetical protein
MRTHPLDRFTQPMGMAADCSNSQTDHVKNAPCPLYVRGGSDANG